VIIPSASDLKFGGAKNRKATTKISLAKHLTKSLTRAGSAESPRDHFKPGFAKASRHWRSGWNQFLVVWITARNLGKGDNWRRTFSCPFFLHATKCSDEVTYQQYLQRVLATTLNQAGDQRQRKEDFYAVSLPVHVIIPLRVTRRQFNPARLITYLKPFRK